MSVVIASTSRVTDVEASYKRAVFADMSNAEILRQHRMYLAMYKEHGRGEEISKCPLDRGSIKCEVCNFLNRWPTKLGPDVVSGGRQRLADIVEAALKDAPPPLEWEKPEKKVKGLVANAVKVFDDVRNYFRNFGTKGAAKRKKLRSLQPTFEFGQKETMMTTTTTMVALRQTLRPNHRGGFRKKLLGKNDRRWSSQDYKLVPTSAGLRPALRRHRTGPKPVEMMMMTLKRITAC